MGERPEEARIARICLRCLKLQAFGIPLIGKGDVASSLVEVGAGPRAMDGAPAVARTTPVSERLELCCLRGPRRSSGTQMAMSDRSRLRYRRLRPALSPGASVARTPPRSCRRAGCGLGGLIGNGLFFRTRSVDVIFLLLVPARYPIQFQLSPRSCRG